ncbi:hypothetical protein ABE10_03050, partial [Bacillus toyonensis]|nr:hypothetical protein [Bacillus toyonensis]
LRLGVVLELTPLRQPAGEAADREQDREHARGEAHRLVDDARVEVDVRVEPALLEVVVGEGDLLELLREVEKRIGDSELGEDLVRRLLDELGTRVVVLVDPVPEAHELDAFLLVLHPLDEALHALSRVTDLTEHRQHGLVRATVKRTGERLDARGDGGELVRPGGADEADGGGRRVLLVVLVQDEEQFKRLRHDRVGLVRLAHDAEVELEEVVHEAQRVVRVEERLPHALLVGIGGDHRQLREHPHGVELDMLRVVRIGLVLVVGRQRRHGRGQHRHRMRRVRERGEEVLEVFVQQRVAADALIEVGELGGRGQLAIDEEPGDLEIGAVLRDLVDRIAPIPEDSLVAVDEGDLGLGRRGVDVPVVESGVSGLPRERREVDAVVAFGAMQDRELGGRVADRQSRLRGPISRCAH